MSHASTTGNRHDEGGLRLRGHKKSSATETPLVTIITVVFNGATHLEQTIKSVLGQTYSNLEYIVIDGGSTDGTLDIVRKHDNRIDYWVSEPDEGIYDAMNKGIALASGVLIGMVNADDWYELDAVASAVVAFKDSTDSIVHGAMHYYDDDQLLFRRAGNSARGLNLAMMTENHPAMFVPTQVYRDVGTYDQAFRTIADWDFVVRCHLAEISFLWIDKDLSNFRIGGVSSATSISRAIEKWSLRKKYRYKFSTLLFLRDLARATAVALLKTTRCYDLVASAVKRGKG